MVLREIRRRRLRIAHETARQIPAFRPMSLTNNPMDKRHFHGALTRLSPYRIAPVQCIGCQEFIESACQIIPGSKVCRRCWLGGIRDIEEARAPAAKFFPS